jgi:ribosomal-protein-alanine N-acetyltransferase
MKTTRPPFSSFPTLKNDRILLMELKDSNLQELIEISFYEGTPAKDLFEAQIMNERIKTESDQGDYLKR